MTPLFADTFYYLALGNAKDVAHKQAVSFAQQSTRRLLTTAWVLTEIGDAWCQTVKRSKFATFATLIQHNPNTTFIPADQGLMDRSIALYLARPDKDWLLTDCTSFLVMTEHNLTDALTADKHFEQAGFRALLV